MLEQEVVPRITEFLLKWRRKTLWLDGIIFGGLLLAFIAVTIWAGYWDGLALKLPFVDNLPGGKYTLYGLLGANAGAVLFDATLDGPLFKNFETGNTREPWVAESYLGFGFRWRTFEFSYVHTWRTREFEEQDERSAFGSLAVLFRFELDH